MDKVVDKIAALGVPGLILLVAMAVTGWTGAAAITAALAMLGGPFGMLGGIAVLGIMGLISQGIAQYGFPEIFKAVVDQLYKNGMSKESIKREVNSYPISRDLKDQISNHLEELD
ncbi:hypothetical protein [Hydrocoleum sp. CS-953]|uniref:hypothetical protein n=1 Tax=Microcoleaceae TaxID=1892252 RepID=UPI000B9BE45F|nr:hypothetical protein [Hydrocoleum sp. CS-953]OZH54310.1 hypothetical protein AFK68_11750 [Hydrocoleum sp. CS-953]